MMNKITWKTETRNIKDLTSNPKNPRNFTEKGMKDLTKSLDRFGVADPIIINTDNQIIGGHARCKALEAKGETTVEVRVPTKKLQDKECEELLIRLNANIAGEWDYDMLANEYDLGELEEWGLELPDMELDEEEEEVVEDEVPELKEESIVVKGDVWLLGRHRLSCLDSTVVTDIDKLMDGKKAHMAFTDPPYNTGMKVDTGSTWLSHMFDDDFTDEEWNHLLDGFTKNIYMALKDDSAAYICLDWRRNHELVPYIKEQFHLSNVIIWDKMVHGLGSDYKYTYEIINVCKKGKPELVTNHGEEDYQDVWHIQRKIGKDDDHATKKPQELVARAIKHASKKGDIILDLFGGSGSTLIAAEQLGRKAYLNELLESYCECTIDRYINLKKNDGEDVFLLRDGKKTAYKEVVNEKRK